MKKNRIIQRIYRDKDIKRISNKIMKLKNFPVDEVEFLNIRIITSIIVFVLILFNIKIGYIIAPLVTIIYYYLFECIFLDLALIKRTKKLDREALVFFEILTLTLESGRNLEHALEVTVLNVNSEISTEFKRTLFEVKFGKSLLEALNDTKKRIPSETINNIILNITQTNIFGNSIIDTMYSQIDFLRDKQILSIKEQINKIPNKISIISVLFIVPIILLIILGPVIINFIYGSM
ncbi:MAG: type II secretion system F family protein [Bacilli bacterium]|nr:type II secretion system F family protein [Bacilli bacterium]